MRPPNVQSFIDKILPYARQAADATGLPLSLILAQWGGESRWAQNGQCQDKNNFGCIFGRYGLKSYPSVKDFVNDWVRVMHLDCYRDVLEAASEGAPAQDVAKLLGESPYDSGHYAQGREERPGSFLQDLLKDFSLTDYDRAGPPAGGEIHPT